MPKKPGSARRRKTTVSMGNGDNIEIDAEVLSESHTIIDDSVFSGDFDGFDEFDEGLEDFADVTPSDPTTKTTNASIRQSKLLDSFSVASTMSTEKRTAKREQSLRCLFKAITQYATGSIGQETISSKLNDIILPICTSGLRSGVASPAEQYASCRVLEATSIVLGGDEDEYCETVQAMLVKVIKATGRAALVRGAALRALAMSCFICTSDNDASDSILDLCESVCAVRFRGEDVPTPLRAIALDCWALLSTTIHGAYICGDDIETIGGHGRGVTILPLLSDCLNSSNLDLRCSAGECVALIHEARLELGVDEDEVENATERRFRRGSWDGSEWEILMDEVKQRVSELSVESSQYMSKKAKKEQRSTFREFVSTIVDDESPLEVVSFRGGTITLNTWREIVQLNFIRHCLQGGFQIQLMSNPTLQIIFGIDGRTLNAAMNMSQLEKRLTMSKTSDASKVADREMLKRRNSKRNKQNFFLSIDGEEI
mmetsp:Transcript_25230/g.28844  ORF Transcript_25230/g.28844 Transcript_25230/m.28844 type:complete len:486 (+) Transcript_25230:157-1614(+)